MTKNELLNEIMEAIVELTSSGTPNEVSLSNLRNSISNTLDNHIAVLGLTILSELTNGGDVEKRVLRIIEDITNNHN